MATPAAATCQQAAAADSDDHDVRDTRQLACEFGDQRRVAVPDTLVIEGRHVREASLGCDLRAERETVGLDLTSAAGSAAAGCA